MVKNIIEAFKTNKGLPDHCSGGYIGGVFSWIVGMLTYQLVSVGVVIVLIGLHLFMEFLQGRNDTKHSNFEKDSFQDNVGAIIGGVIGLVLTALSLKFGLIFSGLAILWLIYSWVYRWKK